MMNSFDGMFDFNHDGRLDAIERAGQMSFLEMAMRLDDMGDDDTDFELDDDNYDEWYEGRTENGNTYSSKRTGNNTDSGTMASDESRKWIA